MSRKADVWPWVVVVALGLGLIAGLASLFRLRFSAGDVYPAYSTLRADPLGTKALHDTLHVVGLDVRRSYRDLRYGPLPMGTIYVCGADWFEFAHARRDAWRSLLGQVEHGGRLVLAFAATTPDDATVIFTEPKDESPPSADHEPERSAADGAEPESARETLGRHLGLSAMWLESRVGEDLRARREASDETLPEAIPWHTALALDHADGAWRVVYSVDTRGAVLERDYGSGTIVVLADNFLLSNEALAQARETSLLVWLQGSNDRAVFDESHLGVNENRGVSTLARRYGLGRAALVLLAAALLLIWRNRSSLVPANDVEPVSDEAQGRESAAGFVSLLSRAVPRAGLFDACLAEFRQSATWRRLSETERAALEAINGPGARKDPLGAMARAQQLLARKY